METSMKIGLVLTTALCFVSAYAEPIVSVETKADLTRIKMADMKDGIISIRQSGEVHSKKVFQVEPGVKYKVSADVRIVSEGKTNILLGFGPLDKDGKQIKPAYVCVRAKSATELAAPVKKGDKIITVKDASAWDNKTPYNYVIFDAKEDLSDLPNTSGLHQLKGSVARQNDVWQVQLTAPVEEDYPAGTMVRQQYDAGTYMYTVTFSKQVEQWTHIEGVASGIAPCGNPGGKFWKGTKSAAAIVVVTGRGAVAEIKNLQVEIVK